MPDFHAPFSVWCTSRCLSRHAAVMADPVNNGRANVRVSFSALLLHCGRRLYACTRRLRRWVGTGRVTEAGLKLQPELSLMWNGHEMPNFAAIL